MDNVFLFGYVVCLSLFLVLGMRFAVRGEWEKVATCVVAAFMFLMAIFPMMISGDVGAFRSGVGS